MKNLNYNPDVLSCLANLSNDEVFTPPTVVNQMLDLLPPELWHDPKATFLDPVCKTGVFLREIAKRLIVGLQEVIPDRQERINHIFSEQLFGIAITELTSMLSRRSVYCSKTANNRYSVCDRFADAQGNIRFSALRHTWENGRCIFCGASQEVYEREDGLESYAYQFIHTHHPEKIFNMKFDVIIGNPPYQLSDGGGRDSSSIPLYNRFVEQALKLRPRYLTMIIPARWYSGGKGLDSFRELLLHDEQVQEIHDFPETKDCFPGVNIRGGVCYFLWVRGAKGNCKVVNHIKDNTEVQVRPLLEKGATMFIRYNKAISILRKVQKTNPDYLGKYVSSRNPFGIPSNFDDFVQKPTTKRNIRLYRFGDDGYIAPEQVAKQQDLIGMYKVLVSKASPGGDEYPHMIVSKPIIAEPNSVCTETYLVIKEMKKEQVAKNLVSYIRTRFFRFMMSLVKNTQNISKASYQYVPLQDFSEPWTDDKLYRKYQLTEEEIAFIESMIRPME
jgi:site-specific DNA-methyltransferase (adenine-specific)